MHGLRRPSVHAGGAKTTARAYVPPELQVQDRARGGGKFYTALDFH